MFYAHHFYTFLSGVFFFLSCECFFGGFRFCVLTWIIIVKIYVVGFSGILIIMYYLQLILWWWDLIFYGIYLFLFLISLFLHFNIFYLLPNFWCLMFFFGWIIQNDCSCFESFLSVTWYKSSKKSSDYMGAIEWKKYFRYRFL